MSFIELTNKEGAKATLNTDSIVAFTPYTEGVGTDIQINGGSPHAASRMLVKERYDEVRRLIGLDWLTCGETYQGDICDRRLDEAGRCPVHGLVGE